MRNSVAQYALRKAFGQTATAHVGSHSAAGACTESGPSDRLITRSAAAMAVFGIALSSFSVKQMWAANSNQKKAKAAAAEMANK